MRVLVTGATGNLGEQTLAALLQDGQRIRGVVRRPNALRRLASRLGARVGQIEIVPGDVTDAPQLVAALAGQDVVVHLAGMLPPESDHTPERARTINVGGLRAVLAALHAQPRPPRLIFSSTVALFGITQDQPPPRRLSDPIHPVDPYSHQKAECEALIRASGLDWTILRFTVIPRFQESFRAERLRAMFAINPGDRMEMIHPADAGRAVANAVSSTAVVGKTLLIAGGPSCRAHMRDYYRAYLDAAGIGALPDAAFSQDSYHLDYYDTAESQALLRYQQHSFEDFTHDLRRHLFWQRQGARLVRPVLRRILLRYAPVPMTRGTRTQP
jgi:UDP-glucose 4-epimerase